MKDIVITVGTAVGSTLAFINAIRSEVDCNCYVLCTHKKTTKTLSSSRLVKEAVYINASDETSYVTQIKEWYSHTDFQSKPLIYCTNDTSCFYINNNREWFSSSFELCLPSSEIINTFTKKGVAELKAAEIGLHVPKTLVIKDLSDVEKVISSFNFPIILKPQATYLKSDISFKLKVINDKNEFTKLVKQHLGSNTILCQEYIPGGDDTSYYYLFYRDRLGNVYDSIGKKTLQSTKHGGIMLKGISEYENEISEISKGFLNSIEYHGIGGIEFKKSNGKYYFIEMNPRIEGILKIAETAGVPLSLISYYDICNNEIPSDLKSMKQVDGINYIDLISTLKNHVKNKEFLSVPFEVISVTFNSKSTINIFDKKDFKPFLLDTFNKL